MSEKSSLLDLYSKHDFDYKLYQDLQYITFSDSPNVDIEENEDGYIIVVDLSSNFV